MISYLWCFTATTVLKLQDWFMISYLLRKGAAKQGLVWRVLRVKEWNNTFSSLSPFKRFSIAISKKKIFFFQSRKHHWEYQVNTISYQKCKFQILFLMTVNNIYITKKIIFSHCKQNSNFAFLITDSIYWYSQSDTILIDD